MSGALIFSAWLDIDREEEASKAENIDSAEGMLGEDISYELEWRLDIPPFPVPPDGPVLRGAGGSLPETLRIRVSTVWRAVGPIPVCRNNGQSGLEAQAESLMGKSPLRYLTVYDAERVHEQKEYPHSSRFDRTSSPRKSDISRDFSALLCLICPSVMRRPGDGSSGRFRFPCTMMARL